MIKSVKVEVYKTKKLKKENLSRLDLEYNGLGCSYTCKINKFSKENDPGGCLLSLNTITLVSCKVPPLWWQEGKSHKISSQGGING